MYYTQSILLGKKSLYIRRRRRKEKEKEKINDVLKGLIEEVRALYKEVAPTKETYVERLKKDLLLRPLYPPHYYHLLLLLRLLEVRKSSYKKGS